MRWVFLFSNFCGPFYSNFLQSEESSYDILRALSEIPMTLSLLKATKVGAVVNRAKKVFPASSNAGELASQLVAEWKRIASSGEKDPKDRDESASPPKSSSQTPPALTPPSSQDSEIESSASAGAADDSDSPRGADCKEIDQEFLRLPKNRLNVRHCRVLLKCCYR